jgi:hypothetical protein
VTRRDGGLVTYRVEVIFDTDNDRVRYDHVGTRASCACCGERLALHGSSDPLVTHARAHERRLSIDTGGATSSNNAYGDADIHEELAGST